VRRDSRGSLPLVDAVLFLAVISVVAALVLAQAPAPRRDPAEEVNRYARSVLDALLETTLGTAVLPGTPNGIVLDAGPAYQVLTEALECGLQGPIDYAPVEAWVGDLLEDLVRADWGWRFSGRAQTAGNSTGFVIDAVVPGVDLSVADYGTARTIIELGDAEGTRVSFSLDLYPAP
jgi:hypothetical protein